MDTQIIGCAYTFKPSLAFRRRATKDISAHHSSQYDSFSYFFKGNLKDAASSGDDLVLRKDPLTEKKVSHWPEPELAIILGKKHQIVGYTLANDLTAFEVEMKGRSEDFDGTFFGKVWKTSVSLGPQVLSPEQVGSVDNLDVGLRIERGKKIIYDHTYNTGLRTREFTDLPELIVKYRKHFGETPPPSKKIWVKNGYLPSGSVILAGTGLIVRPDCYLHDGDVVTVYSAPFGELKNGMKRADKERLEA